MSLRDRIARLFRSADPVSLGGELERQRDAKPERAEKKRVGYYQGRHYTEWAQAGLRGLDYEDLLALIDCVEEEAAVEGMPVAAGYYEELAKSYQQDERYEDAIGVLDRLIAKDARYAESEWVAKRLGRCRTLIEKRDNPEAPKPSPRARKPRPRPKLPV